MDSVIPKENMAVIPREDALLVKRVAAQDPDALAELFDRHSGSLLALAQRILGDRAEAEEVLQEAFLQVWNQAGRYQPQRSSVPTWLVLITRSRAIDRLRSRQVAGRTISQLQNDKRKLHTSPEGAGHVLHAQRRRRLRQEMAELPEEQRQVLELAFYQGMTQSEIAKDTGIPLGTVKTRTLLAMKKLRHALQTDIKELL